eukprot:1345183-Amorphochlora_amoeboformis.AAC.1
MLLVLGQHGYVRTEYSRTRRTCEHTLDSISEALWAIPGTPLWYKLTRYPAISSYLQLSLAISSYL